MQAESVAGTRGRWLEDFSAVSDPSGAAEYIVKPLKDYPLPVRTKRWCRSFPSWPPRTLSSEDTMGLRGNGRTTVRGHLRNRTIDSGHSLGEAIYV
jgi:hypothetical protein